MRFAGFISFFAAMLLSDLCWAHGKMTSPGAAAAAASGAGGSRVAAPTQTESSLDKDFFKSKSGEGIGWEPPPVGWSNRTLQTPTFSTPFGR